MGMKLADFLGVYPSIHVSRVKDGQTISVDWKPTDRELQNKDALIQPYLGHSLNGTGTKDDPYQPPASDQSPYMATTRIYLGMWMELLTKHMPSPFFIKINDYRLELRPFSFKADDGTYTTLPIKK